MIISSIFRKLNDWNIIVVHPRDIRDCSSHYRRKKPENFHNKTLPRIKMTIFQSDLMAGRQRVEKIFLDFAEGGTFVHPDTAFKVKIETAEIQVHGSDRADHVIRNKRLGMIKAVGIFVDFHARLNKAMVIRTSCNMNQFFIISERGDNSDINAAFCRKGKRRQKIVIHYKIRCVDVHIIFRVVDNLNVNMLADIFFVQRIIGIRNNIAIVFNGTGRIFPGIKVRIMIGLGRVEVPHLQRNQSEAPSGISLN